MNKVLKGLGLIVVVAALTSAVAQDELTPEQQAEKCAAEGGVPCSPGLSSCSSCRCSFRRGTTGACESARSRYEPVQQARRVGRLMKAKPVKLVYGEGYVDATIDQATHVTLNFPGPVGLLTLPVIIKGTREGTGCWTWNGDVDKPTLRPSVLTQQPWKGMRCHTWVSDGQAQFLDDCSHELRGKTVDLLEVESA